MADMREEWKAKIRAAKEELKTAGAIHRRDLQRQIHRMQKELRIYDYYQAAAKKKGGLINAGTETKPGKNILARI